MPRLWREWSEMMYIGDRFDWDAPVRRPIRLADYNYFQVLHPNHPLVRECASGCQKPEPKKPQPRDAVRFNLGETAIELDSVTDPETGEVSIIVDHIQVAKVAAADGGVAYQVALETARRIGQRIA